MADLPWWSWISVGLFVSVSSAFFSGPVTLFVWVGIIFVVVGIAKLVMLFVLTPKKKTQKEKKPVQQQRHQQHVRYCNTCRSMTHPQDRFCRFCGVKL
ncbi:hypothetical protein COV18_04350 [Candidatus Woesearchaeota archaeon CG10_big_fil_rev_8_21_14_0_10_37_12]|nr:MAG: hypothetical protein COV18_04350 [Candidatus Woesearchaeota archaeon CG10_big_fil_rev_8_21_14_0_10_37_12]